MDVIFLAPLVACCGGLWLVYEKGKQVGRNQVIERVCCRPGMQDVTDLY
jgi:hypothetical protein